MTRVPGNADGRDGTRQATTLLVWMLVVTAALGAVAGVGAAGSSADLYVDASDASGTNEYETIQAAVDNATSGDVIQVNATGPYHGTVNVTENVTIVSDGATLVGDGTGTAFTINDSLSSVTIEGLTIEEYAVAVDGDNATTNVTLRALVAQNVTTAGLLSAPESAQQVVVEDSRINGTTGSAIAVDNASGTVVVRNTTFRNVAAAVESNTSTTVDAATGNVYYDRTNACLGDEASDADGDGHVNCGIQRAGDAGTSGIGLLRVDAADGDSNGAPYATIQGAVDASDDNVTTVVVEPTGPYGSFTLTRNITVTSDGAALQGSGTAITVQDSLVDVTIEGLTVSGYTTGLDGGSLGGSASLVNMTFDQMGSEAIYGYSSTGPWTLRNVTVTDSNIGISATSASGNWTITNSSFRRIHRAVETDGSGNWTLRNITAVGTAGYNILQYSQSSGDVTVVGSTFTSGDYAIYATDIGGEWSVRNSTFRSLVEAGIYNIGGTGPWTVRNSTFANNGANDIDAKFTSIDATTGNTFSGTLNPCNGDQSGDGNGDGTVNCGLAAANDAGTSADLDIQVDRTAGTSDPDTPHPTIQSGVNAADDGFSTVYVAATGPYTEQVTVDRNLTITSDGATLNGSTTGVTDSALSVASNASVRIEGFHVRDYEKGLLATTAGSSLAVRNATAYNISKYAVGLDGNGTASVVDSSFERVRGGVRGNAVADAGSKNVSVSNLTVVDADNGIAAGLTGGSWEVRNSTFLNASAPGRSSGYVLDFERAEGRVTIADTYAEEGGAGLTLENASDSTTIRNLTLRNLTSVGIDARNASGPHDWRTVDIRNVSTGVQLMHNRNQTTIRDLSIRNASVGIHDVSTAGGHVMALDVTGLRIADAGVAIDAAEVNTNATYADVRITDSGDGILANASTSAWTLRNVTIDGGSSGMGHGIDASGASGNWSIADSLVRDSVQTGLSAINVTGAWTIANTSVKSNGGWGINATGASPEIDAAVKTVFASNALGACRGNVDCGFPPARPTGVSSAGPITADNVTAYDVTIDLADSFEGDSVSVRLSDGSTSVTETKSAGADASNVSFTVNASTLADGDIAVAARTSDEDGTSGFEQFATVTKNATVSTSGSTGGSTSGGSTSGGGGGQAQDAGPSISGFTAESPSPGTVRISLDSRYQLLQLKVSLDGATDHVIRTDAFTFEDGTYVATVSIDGTGRYTAVLERGISETGEDFSGNLDTVYVSSSASTDEHESSASTATADSSSVDSSGDQVTASNENTAGDRSPAPENTASNVNQGGATERGWTTSLAYGTGALGVMALLAIVIPIVLLYRRHGREREYGDMDRL